VLLCSVAGCRMEGHEWDHDKHEGEDMKGIRGGTEP
jgi:hypothetical protein